MTKVPSASEIPDAPLGAVMTAPGTGALVLLSMTRPCTVWVNAGAGGAAGAAASAETADGAGAAGVAGAGVAGAGAGVAAGAAGTCAAAVLTMP